MFFCVPSTKNERKKCKWRTATLLRRRRNYAKRTSTDPVTHVTGVAVVEAVGERGGSDIVLPCLYRTCMWSWEIMNEKRVQKTS